MYGRMMSDAVVGVFWIALLLGVVLGGIVWRVIPWLWHHIDLHVRWLA
mgnify:CR=1 FL=1